MPVIISDHNSLLFSIQFSRRKIFDSSFFWTSQDISRQDQKALSPLHMHSPGATWPDEGQLSLQFEPRLQGRKDVAVLRRHRLWSSHSGSGTDYSLVCFSLSFWAWLPVALMRMEQIDAFKLCCWRRLLRIPWTARRSNQSILKEINTQYSLEGLILKVKL